MHHYLGIVDTSLKSRCKVFKVLPLLRFKIF